jgi:hypothetical protein
MTVPFRLLQRCERCERSGDHACLLLRTEISRAVAEANCRATRHELKMPPAEVTLDCAAFWRNERSHG